MPSPIAHAAVGYTLYRLYVAYRPQGGTSRLGPMPRLLFFGVILSLLPDLDFVPGLLLGDFGQFHNTITHSLFLGLLISMVVGALFWLGQRSRFKFWFVLVLLCYESHVIMDFFTVGRGVMLLWPFSPERYEPPIKLFYGFHRSDGWISIRHFWTVLTELAFAVFIGLVTRVVLRWLPKSETT